MNISCDALLTDHPFFQETELQKIIEKAADLDDSVHTKYCEKTTLLENALERYPRSLELMAVLADTYSKGTDYPDGSARLIYFFRRNVQK